MQQKAPPMATVNYKATTPRPQTKVYTSLVARSLDLAAGMRTNLEAYDEWGINLAKLQKLGKAYREGWLHNVLTRITPITHAEMDDYLMMTDLFIHSKSDAQYLSGVLSRSLSAFATVAGIAATAKVVPMQLTNHVALYEKITQRLEERFEFTAPAPFSSTTISRDMQAQIPFIRSFLKQHFKVG
jgi:hypothetical protein